MISQYHEAIVAVEPKVITVNWPDPESDHVGDADGKVVEYDKEAYKTKLAELDAIQESLAYQGKRELEYPDVRDQLDMIYKAGQGGDAFKLLLKQSKTSTLNLSKQNDHLIRPILFSFEL